jgi:hypothetical protein
MKNRKSKQYETVWTCDYCKKEFKTKKEADKHELKCKKNKRKLKQKYFYIIGSVIFLFLFSLFIRANSLQEKTNNQIKITLPRIVPSITPSPVPTKIISNNSDIVTCSFDPKCEHAPVQLKKSVCQNIVCCNLALDYWAIAMSSTECKQLQQKAIDIYNSIYKNNPPLVLSGYKNATLQPVNLNYNVPTLSVNIPTTSVSQPNTNTDYTAICRDQYNIDISNSKQLSAGAREAMVAMAESNYDRCIQTGISQPLNVTKPSPTPTVIQGIWYGNLGPLQ